MLAILDSNVLVSAVEPGPDRPPARVLESILSGEHRLLLSPALRAEWIRVLLKRELVARHGLEPAVVQRLIDRLEEGSVFDIPPRAAHDCPDPRDQMLWDLLEANPDSVLVTGEDALRRSTDFPGRILSPREFVERFLETS